MSICVPRNVSQLGRLDPGSQSLDKLIKILSREIRDANRCQISFQLFDAQHRIVARVILYLKDVSGESLLGHVYLLHELCRDEGCQFERKMTIIAAFGNPLNSVD